MSPTDGFERPAPGKRGKVTLLTEMETIAVADPSIGEEIGSIPTSRPHEAARVVDAARAAFPSWDTRDPAEVQ